MQWRTLNEIILIVYYVTVLTTLYTIMFHKYVADMSTTLSTPPSYSDFRGTTTFIVGGESNSRTS